MLGVWLTSQPYTTVPKISVQLSQYYELQTLISCLFFFFLQRQEIELDLEAISLGSFEVEVKPILLITESLSLLSVMKKKRERGGSTFGSRYGGQ